MAQSILSQEIYTTMHALLKDKVKQLNTSVLTVVNLTKNTTQYLNY